MTKQLKLFFGTAGKLAALALAVCFLLRIVLICITPAEIGMGFLDILMVFGLGAINDLAVLTIAYAFMWIFMISVTERKYSKPIGWTILTVLALTFIYVSFFNTIFNEYGSVVPTIARCLFGYWLISFALRFFLPGMRKGWTCTWFGIMTSIYVVAIYFNAVSEFFFWNEFNVRYNFIAVDYLIYTHEVIGNIMESYAIVPLFSCVAIVSAITVWAMFRKDFAKAADLYEGSWRLKSSAIYAVAFVASIGIINLTSRLQQGDNMYVNELQANGLHRFYDAFRKSQLDYDQFYTTLPQDEAEAMVHNMYGSTGHNLRMIPADSVTDKRNIVLITIESMSASYMKRYGSTDSITPNLDRIASQSLVFDNLFATGNRTVRGLEAVTLSLPPGAGESVVKHPANKFTHSTGKILKDNGYKVTYFYGGNSYFDNMGSFFGNNGYDIVDVTTYQPGEITFSNIWGVCDEDAFAKALKVIDTDAATGQPFFAHIMTISNHRPFTYPAGRIPIPNDSKRRAGGVMYSDYALGKFLEEASSKPWFANTVFVILADHCASSAGKSELPLDKYHIPAMIYAPGFIEPQSIDKVTSQIDVMPTLLAKLGFGYESTFFGQDVLAPDYKPRAFIATYQDLGYLEDSVLTVLSPVKRVRQYRWKPSDDNAFHTEITDNLNKELVNKAVAIYQSSAKWTSEDAIKP